ncbi:hypothetical protein [Actinokineospora sp. UTMC 2448]|uniref:hypothetical protein n=1 Tax=Actinokineospora sp. UTMC 2448 TaxID=2268449 RepID=UPI0037C1A9F4
MDNRETAGQDALAVVVVVVEEDEVEDAVDDSAFAAGFDSVVEDDESLDVVLLVPERLSLR